MVFFEKVGGVINPETYNAYSFIKKLDELIIRGEEIYNPAYVVCPFTIKPDYRPKEKHVQIAFVLAALKEKLKEEVDEFLGSENIEKLADILEVIDAICKLNKIDKRKLKLLHKKKREERGGFKRRIVLDKIK
jgi:predicted house-cleaning noncanonical NTP pyrophosphatase (MazG superfamily)